MSRSFLIALLLCGPATDARFNGRGLVIYDGVATEIRPSMFESDGLWLTLSDLTRATKFTLKPEGVCRDDRCIPIPVGRQADFVKRHSGETWFNLAEFGRLLKQPVARDIKRGIWCFGTEPAVQNAHIASRLAPDFTLPDVNGKSHKLSDFRGKKVLLLTWASW